MSVCSQNSWNENKIRHQFPNLHSPFSSSFGCFLQNLWLFSYDYSWVCFLHFLDFHFLHFDGFAELFDVLEILQFLKVPVANETVRFPWSDFHDFVCYKIRQDPFYDVYDCIYVIIFSSISLSGARFLPSNQKLPQKCR